MAASKNTTTVSNLTRRAILRGTPAAIVMAAIALPAAALPLAGDANLLRLEAEYRTTDAARESTLEAHNDAEDRLPEWARGSLPQPDLQKPMWRWFRGRRDD